MTVGNFFKDSNRKIRQHLKAERRFQQTLTTTEVHTYEEVKAIPKLE